MQSDLDRHRVRKQTCGAQPARHQAGITEQDRRQLISGDKISFEGVFDGDRLGLSIRLYRPVVAGVRQVHQSVGMMVLSTTVVPDAERAASKSRALRAAPSAAKAPMQSQRPS